MSTNRKLVVANWKAYVTSRKDTEALFRAVTKSYAKLPAKTRPELVFCPPFPYLAQVSGFRFQDIRFGAQDVFWEEKGAYTGEVTASMLKDLGVTHVIIGHSERRKHMGETDEMVNKKILAALKAKLRVILCVGEWQQPRTPEDEKTALDYVKAQLEKDLARINASAMKNVTIAYEPVWAIGTGIPDTPREAAEVILFIRRVLAKQYGAEIARKTQILYGGSVNAENVVSFIREKTIDGMLVGGASIKSSEFIKILESLARTD